ncbi:MAG: Cyclic AMP receptor protein [Alphaproteobacteria bacterium MarineAlpha2_Bin1]|nr:MAG: Cyclic AMP receptor protein [Alphaproteobacteria bacterium MarineAlpha2_Bin1]
MNQKINLLLSKVNLLKNINDDDLNNLSDSGAILTYNLGEQIIDRNSDNKDVFFVISGSVRVVNYSNSGREIAFAKFSEGDFFGEISAIDGKPRSANVVAIENCTLISVKRDSFINLLNSNSKISFLILKRFTDIIRISDERIMDLSTLRAVQRVYVELLRRTDKDAAVPELWVIRPMPSHSLIASLAGTTRETVARVLSNLSDAKIVEKKSKALYIRNKNRLEQLAEITNSQSSISKN